MIRNNLTIKEIHSGLEKKEFSCYEIVSHYLKKAKHDRVDAFLSINNGAIEKAKMVDNKIARKEKISLLEGIPYSVKDAILVKDLKCTAGSKILENYTAVESATCIRKLDKEGSIVIGKTNTDDFTMGSSTERSAFKTTKNPKDITRVPGGSSGGSAASVGDDSSVFSLGSDTGGSIRQPASFCGVVGLKPTYGAVSRYGLIAHASSLDQIGPITKTVEDAEIVFNAIRGKDEKDSTSMSIKEMPVKKKFKIGIVKEYFSNELDKDIKKAIENKIKDMDVVEISLPHSKYALACYYIISTSEASANLARFDGIRYGLHVDGEKLKRVYLKTRGMGFGQEVKRRIMLGTFCLSSGYYDAYYLKAQKVRTLIKQDFEKAFEKVDFIIAPTSPFTAFKIGEKMNDPLQMYLADIYTISLNLAGLPGISIPCAEIKGLPVGMQVIGKPFSENNIFNFVKNICPTL